MSDRAIGAKMELVDLSVAPRDVVPLAALPGSLK